MSHSSTSDDMELANDLSLEDDYYALLNLSKNASTEEITNAYRRFSRLYHPDKHLDPVKKKNAEILFNKIKVAFEVLNDPHQRAIYDTLGVKGLETEGWQIVERTKTPQEIREEFQQLLREKEERILQQRTNPKGTVIVQVNATDLFETYDNDYFYNLPAIEISSMSISQSVQAPLSVSETLNLSGSLQTQNGNGAGNVSCSIKRVFSAKRWGEFSLGAGNGLLVYLKGFSTMGKHSFCTAQTSVNFVNTGFTPGFELMFGRQMGKRTSGYVTWKAGRSSSMTTTISHDTEKNHFAAGLQFSPRTSHISLSYTKKLEDEGRLKCAVKLGVFGVILEYGCEKKLTKLSNVGAAMVVGVPSGVTLKLKVTRANQSYIFPILLSEEVLPSAIFYGTAVPIVGWYMLKVCFIDPYNKRQKQKESEKNKEANAQKMAEKRKEAAIAVSLMQETYKRIVEEEKRKNGLIITMAIYGNTDSISNLNMEQIDSNLEVANTTVQLQCLVKDSRLILPDRPKSNMPGFYDPCLGEEKSLLVNYLYRNIAHSITIKDSEMLRIPRIVDF
ncbi:dnaJ homolog subfamily C member 11 [Parasteatoda tepidariorum]|uniref:dnaJ homolog subfamily C member 11 n=1 Tax=Parasteatoda tepidariorum TaxID=114398 RepID=UPI000A2C0156|nr:dnaJ homolog subfamily C member 11 [Parasteatoda tepidariorum]